MPGDGNNQGNNVNQGNNRANNQGNGKKKGRKNKKNKNNNGPNNNGGKKDEINIATAKCGLLGNLQENEKPSQRLEKVHALLAWLTAFEKMLNKDTISALVKGANSVGVPWDLTAIVSVLGTLRERVGNYMDTVAAERNRLESTTGAAGRKLVDQVGNDLLSGVPPDKPLPEHVHAIIERMYFENKVRYGFHNLKSLLDRKMGALRKRAEMVLGASSASEVFLKLEYDRHNDYFYAYFGGGIGHGVEVAVQFKVEEGTSGQLDYMSFPPITTTEAFFHQMRINPSIIPIVNYKDVATMKRLMSMSTTSI